jgi:hypothetical protein
MGRSFMKAILNSARGIHPADNSPAAQNARRIAGFAELDGIEFLGKVDWEKDQHGQDKSVIKSAVTPDHRDYAARMGAAPRAPAAPGGFGSGAPAAPMAPAASTPPAASRVPARPSLGTVRRHGHDAPTAPARIRHPFYRSAANPRQHPRGRSYRQRQDDMPLRHRR